MRVHARFLVGALLVGVARLAPGQSGIQIRQGFLTTKDVAQPASLFWTMSPTSNPSKYALANVAVKVVEWQPPTAPSFFLYPVLEYHLAGGGSAPQNKLSLAANIDWVATANLTTLSPDLTASAKDAYDLKAHKNQQVYSLILTPYGTDRGSPGRMIRFRNDAQLFRYYFHVGLERYVSQAALVDSNASVLLGAVAVELDPLPTPTAQYLQITPGYSYRRVLGHGFPTRRDLGDFSLTLASYLDAHQHFGIGIDYANGRDATRDFARREETSVGFRVKF